MSFVLPLQGREYTHILRVTNMKLVRNMYFYAPSPFMHLKFLHLQILIEIVTDMC